MAHLLANEFKRVEKKRNSIYSHTTGTYTSFDFEGKHYFQIDTYGSNGRRTAGQSSQNIQIDEEGAKMIVELLKKEFHLD